MCVYVYIYIYIKSSYKPINRPVQNTQVKERCGRGNGGGVGWGGISRRSEGRTEKRRWWKRGDKRTNGAEE